MRRMRWHGRRGGILQVTRGPVIGGRRLVHLRQVDAIEVVIEPTLHRPSATLLDRHQTTPVPVDLEEAGAHGLGRSHSSTPPLEAGGGGAPLGERDTPAILNPASRLEDAEQLQMPTHVQKERAELAIGIEAIGADVRARPKLDLGEGPLQRRGRCEQLGRLRS